MTPSPPEATALHRARAQALFDAVLRTRADVPDRVRIHCAAAVSELGVPFADMAAARASAGDSLFDLDPAGSGVEAAIRAGLRELGRLPAEEFSRAMSAAGAGHDALQALS